MNPQLWRYSCTKPSNMAPLVQAFKYGAIGTRSSALAPLVQGIQVWCHWYKAFRCGAIGTRSSDVAPLVHGLQVWRHRYTRPSVVAPLIRGLQLSRYLYQTLPYLRQYIFKAYKNLCCIKRFFLFRREIFMIWKEKQFVFHLYFDCISHSGV